MKALLPLLSSLIVFTSCVDYDGSFRANEKLKFKHSTVFGNSKTKTLDAGRYKTSFEVTSGKKLKFTFRGDETVEVKMDIPDNIELPTSDGSFFYMSEETGQNYDIKGNLHSEYSSSGIYDGVESCNYIVHERQCQNVCESVEAPIKRNDENRGERNPAPRPTRPRTPVCRQVCNVVPVTRYGHQNVRYRINTTKKTLTLEMTKPGSGSQVADYRGLDESSVRSYEYRSTCR